MVATVTSAGFHAGNFANMKLNNDAAITVEPNENGHYRGLHIVIMSPNTGIVVFAKIFDTYKSSEALDSFIENNSYERGHIILAAC